MDIIYKNILTILVTIMMVGCAATGNTKQQKQRDVLNMKNAALTDLFKAKPHTRSMVKKAPGYAVFSNGNVNLIFASFGGGYGLVKNNKTGKYTYMRMGEVGIGLGLGIKDFRAIFVFHDIKTMNTFINKGWQFGGHADAAAKSGDKGAAVGAEALIDNITIFQLTKNGLALQATVKGTKYWKDDELN